MNNLFASPENPFQTWLWIELIGFDNEAADFGVADYMRRAKFVPYGVAIMVSSSGFALSHDGLDEERSLAPCEQSRWARPHGIERSRQDWTNYQLKGLIAELQRYGCKVFLEFSSAYQYPGEDGETVTVAYYQDKHYLSHTLRDGRQTSGIYMLKRLADGRLFEDVLQPKTVQAILDYNFDGLQIRDGVCAPLKALQEADYSDDMIDQFLTESGVVLPAGLKTQAEGDASAMASRAQWIWEEKRPEWVAFHAQRWGQFYAKFVRRLHEAGKTVSFNSAWTRDPFESMYRYGVDYRKVAATGIEGCMVEDVSAGLAILSERDNGYLMNDEQRRRVHYEYLAALMLNRAAMPKVAITPLAGVHDTYEEWGVLEHMPTAMTRSVMANLNTYFYDGGRLKPITDGPFFCLADGLKESDWDFIRRNWDIGYSGDVEAVCGATLIWSDARLDSELAAFMRDRRTPTHQLVSELLYAGAPIGAVARVEDLDQVTGAILVTNADLLPAEEQAAVKAYDRGPVLYIGCREASLLPAGAEDLVMEQNTFGDIHLQGVGCEAAGDVVRLENEAAYTCDAKRHLEAVGMLWTHPLAFAPITSAFYDACAAAIVRVSGAPVITAPGMSETGVPRQVCKYAAARVSEKTYRVYISNDDYYYNHPTLDMGREIERVTCLTKYRGYKVQQEGSTFTARIPGRGMEAFEVVLR